MAYILKKIGKVSNIPSYHFECDNNEDVLTIPLTGVPMSSTCYVINEGTMYTLNSEREWIITMRGSTGGGGSAANSDAVLYTEQELSEEQQMQARKNLGLYGKSIGEVDIIPEQQVTFVDGSAEVAGGVLVDGDNSYHGLTAVLVVNGEEYEGTLEYFSIAMFYRGTFGPYSLNMNDTLSLGADAPVQDGDTVTVRLYAIGTTIFKVPDEYLPEPQQVDDYISEYSENPVTSRAVAEKLKTGAFYSDGEEFSVGDMLIVKSIDDNTGEPTFGKANAKRERLPCSGGGSTGLPDMITLEYGNEEEVIIDLSGKGITEVTLSISCTSAFYDITDETMFIGLFDVKVNDYNTLSVYTKKKFGNYCYVELGLVKYAIYSGNDQASGGYRGIFTQTRDYNGSAPFEISFYDGAIHRTLDSYVENIETLRITPTFSDVVSEEAAIGIRLTYR